MKILCSSISCRKKHYALGYCKKHYTQFSRHGRLTLERERGRDRVICSVANCKKVTHGCNTHCKKHYHQIKTYGRLTPEKEHVMGHVGCFILKCKEKHRAKGFCTKHYNKIRQEKIREILKEVKKQNE